jgi:cell division protein FtsQ
VSEGPPPAVPAQAVPAQAVPAAGVTSAPRATPAAGFTAVPGPSAPGPSAPGPSAPGPSAPGTAPRRRPRPRSRWRTAFFGLAVLATVAGVFWALLGDRLVVVRSVSVTGTRLLAPAQVTAAAGVPLGSPLFGVNAGEVTRRVEAIRQVASAKVTKDWPNGLTIAVTERVPVLALKMADGGYDQVDKTGVVVLYTQAKPAALPLLTTALSGRALPGSTAAAAAAAVLGELKPSLAQQVAGVKPSSVAAGPEQVTLTLRDGKTIVWGGTDDAAQKNRELTIVLAGGARHIDVSAPGTVVTH